MFGNFGTVITTLSPKGPQVAIIFYSGLGEVLRLIPNYKLFSVITTLPLNLQTKEQF